MGVNINALQLEANRVRGISQGFLCASLLATKPQHFPLDTFTASLRVWMAIPQILKCLPHAILTLLPLKTIANILPNLHLQSSMEAGIHIVGGLYSFSDFMFFANLQVKYSLSPKMFYVYLRIRSMLTTIQLITNDVPLLKFYETNNRSTKCILHIYERLSESLMIASQEQISYWTTFMSTAP